MVNSGEVTGTDFLWAKGKAALWAEDMLRLGDSKFWLWKLKWVTSKHGE